MIDVPPQNEHEPAMKLFKDLQELQDFTGEKYTHGYFDPSTNTIVATIDSCAHELGHFRDFKSGRLKRFRPEMTALERAQTILRNEIVAILFSAQKLGRPASLMSYEVDFLDWFEFSLQRRLFPLTKPLKDWSFSEIQDFADHVVAEDHEWFERLEFIFRHYLSNEHITLTYRSRVKRGQSA